MAKQSGKSGLMAKLGDRLRKAHEAHKDDDVKFDTNGGLPAGIENGIAKLTECKFGVYDKGDNKGEYFFMAAGVIVEPKFHDKIPVAGQRTMIMEPMCDTPSRSRKTVDEHVANVYNELKKLGGDTAEFDPNNLEDMAALMKEAAPHFRFRTWASAPTPQYPKSRTNEVWNGIVEGYEPEEDSDGVEDDTEPEEEKPAPPPKKAVTQVTKAPSQPAKAPKKAPEPEPEADPEEAGGDEEGPNLDSLVKDAMGSNKKLSVPAQQALEKLALEAGAGQKEIDEAADWGAVRAMIEAGGSGGEEEAAEAPDADEAFTPAVDEIYAYSPIDPKTKNKPKKPYEVEVTAVNPKSKTATLKNLDSKVVYKDVPWAALEQA